MTRRRSPTDALLVLVAVALLVVWFISPRSESTDGFAAADWSDLVTESPSTITIRRGDQQLTLVHNPDSSAAERYAAKDQHGARTDPAPLDRLILALSRLEVERRVDALPTDHGLVHPRIDIELDARDGKRAISLGDAALSPKDAHYAAILRDGRRQVVVISPTSAQSIDIVPDALLDHRVLDFLPSELHQLKWSAPDGSIALARNDDGHWTIATSSRARARRRTVERLLLALTELSLTKHLDPTAAAAGFPDDRVTEVTILARRDDREETVRMRVGGTCRNSSNELTLLVEGGSAIAGCIAKGAFDALLPARSALIDDAVFSLRSDEVEQLEVRGIDLTWTLTRDGSAFRFRGEKELAVALTTGNGLLDSLVSVRGTSLEPCDFDSPRDQRLLLLRSYVLGNGGPSIERVRLGALADDGTRRVCRDDGIELMLSPSSSRLLELHPVLLRDPSLLDVPVEAITEVRIKAHSEHLLLRVDEQHRFVLVEPRRPVLDAATVETLRERLSQLHAGRWLIPLETKPLDAQGPDLSIDFVVSGNRDGDIDAHAIPSRHQLRVVLDKRGVTVFGWFDRDPTPFQLDRSLAELLTGVARSLAKNRADPQR